MKGEGVRGQADYSRDLRPYGPHPPWRLPNDHPKRLIRTFSFKRCSHITFENNTDITEDCVSDRNQLTQNSKNL